MKVHLVALIVFFIATISIQAQDTLIECFSRTRGPKSISMSYFGEMITHPGLKIGYNHQLNSWIHHKKRKSKKKEEYIYVRKSIQLNISGGGFNHNRYQSAYFSMVEPKYRVENQKGGFWELGLNGGGMRTVTPSVYVENGDLKEKYFFNDYFISSLSFCFGKNLSISRNIPLEWFTKPQLMYAQPNFPNGVGYFALEIGVSYYLKVLR